MRRSRVRDLPASLRPSRSGSVAGPCVCTRRARNCARSGAGIYLWHNGLRVLEGLGILEEVLSGSHTPPTYETWMHNKSVSRETFNGLPWRIMTRQHLHDALARKAKTEGVEVLVNSEVIQAKTSGQITLANGEVREADLVVGADGVGSKVRDSIGFEQDRWISTDGLIRLIVPRKKKELGHGEWDNTIDMWNFWPRVQRILYSPCNDNDLYLGLMAPAPISMARVCRSSLIAGSRCFRFSNRC